MHENTGTIQKQHGLELYGFIYNAIGPILVNAEFHFDQALMDQSHEWIGKVKHLKASYTSRILLA